MNKKEAENVRIPLSRGMFAIVDSDMGWLLKFKWHAEKNGRNYYARTNWQRNNQHLTPRMHHLIIGQSTQRLMVDHINGNSLDNRKSNLRFITNRENQANSHLRREGKTSSRYFGVHFHKNRGKWFSQLTYCGKYNFLGMFDNEHDAGKAYQDALKKYREGE